MNVESVALWLANLAGFLGAIYLIWMNAKLVGDWFTHVQIFSVMWGGNIIISQVVYGGIIRPQIHTLIILFLAWWAFLIGSILILRRRHQKLRYPVQVRTNIGKGLLLLIIVLQYSGIIYEIQSQGLWGYAHLSDFLEIYSTFRLTGQLAMVDLPWFLEIWRWGYVWYIPLATILRAKKNISRKIYVLILMLALLSCLVKFTRAPLIQMGSISLVSWMIIYKPKNTEKVLGWIILAGVGIIVFLVIQLLLIRHGSIIGFSILESALAYFGGSFKAYETILKDTFPIDETGFYTFDAINYILFKLSLINDYPNLVRPFVFIPFPTNLFTYLDAFTIDFGIFGAILGAFLVGGLNSYFYNRVNVNPNLPNLVIYSYLVYACIMSPANNEIIRFSFILYFVFAILINFIITRKYQKPVSLHNIIHLSNRNRIRKNRISTDKKSG